MNTAALYELRSELALHDHRITASEKQIGSIDEKIEEHRKLLLSTLLASCGTLLVALAAAAVMLFSKH